MAILTDGSVDSGCYSCPFDHAFWNVSFHFFGLHLLPDDAAKHLKDGKLVRCLGKHEMRNSSGYYYVDCIPITPEQVFVLPQAHSSGKHGREVLVPTAYLSLPHDAQHLVKDPGYQIIIGADRRGYLVRPIDSILSQRSPYAAEFRKLYLSS